MLGSSHLSRSSFFARKVRQRTFVSSRVQYSDTFFSIMYFCGLQICGGKKRKERLDDVVRRALGTGDSAFSKGQSRYAAATTVEHYVETILNELSFSQQSVYLSSAANDSPSMKQLQQMRTLARKLPGAARKEDDASDVRNVRSLREQDLDGRVSATLASSSSSHSNLPAVSALSKEGRTSVWSDSFRSSSSSTRSIVTLDDIKRSVELQDFKRSKLFV